MSGRGVRRVLALLLALAPLAHAGPDDVAVVLDRSASLRHADPDGRGPRVVALALALVARPGQRLVLLPTSGAEVGPLELDADPTTIATALRRVLGSAPVPGGADLLRALTRAREVVGLDGLVVVFTDDDLDVIGADGEVDEAVLALARRDGERPTRDEVNHAALELLVERMGRGRVVALRAPLPRAARATPFCGRIASRVVPLEGDDLGCAARLAAAIAGEPVAVALPPSAGPLGYPARVVLLAPRATPLERAASLDGSAGRVWLVDTEGRDPLPPGAESLPRAVRPRLSMPEGLRAFALRGGVRVVAASKPEAGGLAVRDGDDLVPLLGDPPTADLVLPGELREVTVARTLDGPSVGPGEPVARAVTGRRAVPVTPVEVVLAPRGAAHVGRPLVLAGRLPEGFVPRGRLFVRARESSGAAQRIEARVSGSAIEVELVPTDAGPLSVETDAGEVPVRLGEPLAVLEGRKHKLAIESLTFAGPEGAREVPAGERLVVEAGAPLAFTARIALDPPLDASEEPLPLALTAEGPPGVTWEAAPVALRDRAEGRIEVRLPAELDDAVVTIRARASSGPSLSAGHRVELGRRPSWLRRGVAIGLVLFAILWAVVLVRRRASRGALMAAVWADKQVRAVGVNGRLTFERYRLIEHAEDGRAAIVAPEDSPGGRFEVVARDDGTVLCKALDKAQLVHEDRPTVLCKEAVLRHGTCFALVHDKRARRYVYLEREPTADELSKRIVQGDVSQEPEVQDSGVYVLLDDEDENLASGEHMALSGELFGAHPSARLVRASAEEPIELGRIFPPPRETRPLEPARRPDVSEPSDMGSEDETFGSSDDTTAVVSDEGPRPPNSDEGIVIMDSTEAEIMDSAEVDRIMEDTEVRKIMDDSRLGSDDSELREMLASRSTDGGASGEAPPLRPTAGDAEDERPPT